MREKIREAFDSVHAEPELKAAARQAVARRAARRHRPIRRLGIALAAAACAVVLAGGWLYATPTVQISIDINPSLELGINRLTGSSRWKAGTMTAPHCADGERDPPFLYGRGGNHSGQRTGGNFAGGKTV